MAFQVGPLYNARRNASRFLKHFPAKGSRTCPTNPKNRSQMVPKSMKIGTLRAPGPSLGSCAPRGVPMGGLFQKMSSFWSPLGPQRVAQNVFFLTFFRRSVVLSPLFISVPFPSSILNVSGTPRKGKTSNSAADGR
jgi:hypothetical protein